MLFPADEIEELKLLNPNLSLAEEGGRAYIRIDGLRLPAGCLPATMTALLCPSPHSGYTSRLFLSQQIAHKGRGQNWNAQGVVILGQKWWAVSWKIAIENKRLLSKLQAHLEAFKP